MSAPSRIPVSVILPSYNYGRFLEQRINSIVNQTFSDFELIIVDDASTDDSLEVIAGFDDPRIIMRAHEVNSGSVYQRWNEAAALARGEYLWFAGADDYCEPTLLEELVKRMNASGSTGIAFSQSWMVSESGEKLFLAPAWTRTGVRAGAAARQSLLLDTTVATASAALLRTSVFRAAGMFDLGYRYAADWKLYIRMLKTSDLDYLAKPLNYCRLHSLTASSIARRSGAEALERYRLIREACSECSDLEVLRQTSLDREAARCLVHAANSLRKGRFNAAMQILQAGRGFDDQHGFRLIRHIPQLGKAVCGKLLELRPRGIIRSQAMSAE